MLRPSYQGVPNAPRQPTSPPSIAPIAQSQPPPGYSELDKYESRIKSHMKRMLRESNERM